MFDFLFRKHLSLSLEKDGRVLILSFLANNKKIESIEVLKEHIFFDHKYKLSRSGVEFLFDFINENAKLISGGLIRFSEDELPQILSIIRKTPLENHVSDELQKYELEELTFLDSRVDYVYGFVPNQGVEKMPALFLEKKEFGPTELRKEPPQAIIQKEKIIFFSHNWIKDIIGKRFIHLSEDDYQVLLNSNKELLSPELTYEIYNRQNFYRYKFSTTEDFKKTSFTSLRTAPVLSFQNDKLVAEIKSSVINSNRYESGEVIESIPPDKDLKHVYIKDYDIYKYSGGDSEFIKKKLLSIGFKVVSSLSFYTSNFDIISKLLSELRHKDNFDGLPFILDETLRSVSMSEEEVEPLVSVSLDAGKSLVYLDVNYYFKKDKIDSAKIQRVINNKGSVIKIGHYLLKVDYKNCRKISDGVKKKKTLPLDEFYSIFELTRLSKRVNFSKSYEDFFRDLYELKNLPYCEFPKYLKRDVLVHPHQQVGFRWLSFLDKKGLNGILADEMGLGKTLESLLTIFSSKNFEVAPNLIVCPKSLVEHWRSEVEHFFNFKKVIIHYGNNRPKKYKAKQTQGAIIITTYDVLRKDFKIFLSMNLNYLVLDEAQKIKNPKTSMSKAAKILHANHKLAISGTPIENRLSELWSIFDFLMPGFWGTPNQFRKQYEIPIVKNKNKQALDELRKISRPLILRRKSEEVFQLPGLKPAKEFCDLYDEQLHLYKELIDNPYARKIIKGIKEDKIRPTSQHVLALIQKLRMICSHPDLITKKGVDGKRSGKMELMFQIIKDLVTEKDNRILIFIEFKRNYAFIEHWLNQNKISFVSMHGGTSVTERKENIKFFNEGKARIFLVGLKVGGLGLNLTKANYVLLFDRWWNPAVEQQAVARAHRYGQKRIVTAYRFVTKGTIEERLEELHEKKKELFEGVLETERLYDKLSKEDILKLLRKPGEHAKVSK